MSKTIRAAFAMAAVTAGLALSQGDASAPSLSAASAAGCDAGNGGLTLPPGFCATVFADGIGHARHLAVAADGVVYVNTWSGRYYAGAPVHPGGLLVALKDSRGDGHADIVQRFGADPAKGGMGGTGIGLFKDFLYAEEGSRIVRYGMTPGRIAPTGKPETILSGMPLTGDHPMHPFVIDGAGNLFVDMGTATNACQTANRQAGSRGHNPCIELATRGGIWRYRADKPDQAFSPAGRYATGLRNGEGLDFDAAGRLFATQHGRDQLSQNWPKLYPAKDGPELPAEELVELRQGGDYGWPACYFDGRQQKLVMAPEYGGDGGHAVGLCAGKQGPVAAFPAHWAPNDLMILKGGKAPVAYRGGAFIAFHGSWNRAPAPQGGYNIIFQPLADGKASGRYTLFADGFAGAQKDPGGARYRPSGIAEGPDGAIYVADDVRGRIWRITFHGGPGTAGIRPATASRGGSAGADALPPEGLHADAGRADASLPVPPGATAAEVALGNRIFHGEAAGGTCSGCHGSNGSGSPMGADLTSGHWIWGDGTLAALRKTIVVGVPVAKKSSGAMPPKGGSALTDAEVKAVSAYVWAIGHKSGRN